MKKLLNYIPVLGVALAFAACESDLDGATYNAETAQAAVLRGAGPFPRRVPAVFCYAKLLNPTEMVNGANEDCPVRPVK